jgi:FkbM family methyltransferase
MLSEKFKNVIRSSHVLRWLVFPLAVLVRWARKRKERRFWDFCLSLPKLVHEPVFVKVGAADGITADPFSALQLNGSNWRGLLIEPVPYYFDRLKANFPDARRFSVEQVAIGAPAGEAAFYYVDETAKLSIPNLPAWYEQLGSFDRSHITKHLNGVLEPFIVECKVQVRPLSDVLRRNGIQDVHLLIIDAEGHDYEVVKTLDLAVYAPLLIFVEHQHLPAAQKTEMVQLLRELGYSVGDNNEDYFAFNEKAIKRLQARTRH